MSETISPNDLAAEIIVNDSLSLRRLEPADSSAMFGIMQADPNIHSYITWAAGKESVDDVRRAIEMFQQNGESRYALLENGEAIGYIGAFKSPHIENEYEFGYFCAPAKRGKGYIVAATKALMIEAKERLGAQSFSLYIQDQNLASQAVALKLEFSRTEELREDEILKRVERRYEKVA